MAVDSPDTRLTIKEERCYATPTQDPDDDMKYDIIRDRYIVAMLLSCSGRLVSIALTTLQLMVRCLGAVIGPPWPLALERYYSAAVTSTRPVVYCYLPSQ